MVQGREEPSPTDAVEVEWVTLVSKDDYHFVIDKRFALQSVFIRSMLGGGGPGGDKPQRSKRARNGAATTAGASAEATLPAGAAAQDSASQARMREHATPPPGASSALTTAANGEAAGAGDPEGYVNPFAASAVDGTDDEARAFNSFEDGFAEAQSNVVRLPNIRGQVLETVVEYLCWNAKYSGPKTGDIRDFEYRIPPEIALEVLMAADYLNEA